MGKGHNLLIKAISLNESLYRSDVNHDEKMRIYDKYLNLIKAASYLGNMEAQFEYGQTFEDVNYLGNNPFANPKKCFLWYSKAANLGHPEACNNLALLYEKGEGCPMNLEKALFYYKRGSDLGSKTAQKNFRTLRKQLRIKNKLDVTI